MGLPDVYRKRCQELSIGMQQKVQLIAAVIHDPDLLILDEPFSGLDPVNSQLLNQVLAELHAQYLACGVRNRDDLTQMRKYDPSFSGKSPRF